MDKGVKISEETYDKVSERAKEERRSKKTVMEMAIENYLKRKDKKCL